ncbi:MAG: glycosyltransferase family 2 protein [Lachnospiraceae bacterium]|nr:glycosyltransferase family 2 protein [Lachnospiraceae bacterium]
MTSNILLSICIPTYNRADTLKLALKSIEISIKGYETQVEICISDNNSVDNTKGVVEEFATRIPIKYHRMKNTVPALINWNYTVKSMSDGKYVIMIGDDDIFVNEGIKRLLEQLRKYPDYDYFYLNHTHRQIGELENIVNYKHCREEIMQVECECYRLEDCLVGKWEEILNFDGKYRDINMLYIGNHVFRPKLWEIEEYDFQYKEYPFLEENLEYYYKVFSPQVKIFAKSMMGKSCRYVGSPIIIQGLGTNDTVLDSTGEVLLVTFLGRWEEEFMENGMDKKEFLSYHQFIQEDIIKRIVDFSINRPDLLEEKPFILNYIKNRLYEFKFWNKLFYNISSIENDYYLNSAKNELDKRVKEAIEQSVGDVVLWGTGFAAKNYLKNNGSLRNSISYVVDGNIHKHGEMYKELNLMIHAPDSLIGRTIKLLIIGSIKHEESIKSFLRANELTNIQLLDSRGLEYSK